MHLNQSVPISTSITLSKSEVPHQFNPGETSDLLVSQLEELKALKLCRIDLDGRSDLCDFILICEGRSQIHCRGISERVVESLKKKGIRHKGIEGESEGNWILIDYGDVILHIFHSEIRKYYDLEGLYKGFRVETWSDPA